MTPPPPAPENPRVLLAAFIEDRLGNPGRTRNGALAAFLGRLQTNLRLSDEDMVSYRNLVWLVRAGRKTIPNGADEAWAKALGLTEGTIPWLDYHKLLSSARAWGKVDVREHFEFLEARVAELEAQNQALLLRIAKLTRQRAGGAKRLTDSEAELEAVRAGLRKGGGTEPEVLRPDLPDQG
jgi:hypothetical protein